MNAVFNRVLHIIVIFSLLSEGANLYANEERIPFSLLIMNIKEGRSLVIGDSATIFKPRPLGSLCKLLLLPAYNKAGRDSFPVFNCYPSSVEEHASETCWYKPGHGMLGFEQALAQSCNTYFREFYNLCDHKLLVRIISLTGAHELELRSFSDLITKPVMSPAQYASLVAALFNGGTIFRHYETEAKVRVAAINHISVDTTLSQLLLKGLALSKSEGTATAANKLPIVVKTGTTWHYRHEDVETTSDPTDTDGLCLMLYPEDRPEFIFLLVAPMSDGKGAVKLASSHWQTILNQIDSIQ
jgi:hypothetical protein